MQYPFVLRDITLALYTRNKFLRELFLRIGRHAHFLPDIEIIGI